MLRFTRSRSTKRNSFHVVTDEKTRYKRFRPPNTRYHRSERNYEWAALVWHIERITLMANRRKRDTRKLNISPRTH